MKRFLSLLLTIVMCISMSSVAFAADSTDMMSDVEKAKPININGNVANPCTIGGTETWYDVDYSDQFTFYGNNLTPVKTMGRSGKLVLFIAYSNITTGEPVKLRVQIRAANTQTVLKQWTIGPTDYYENNMPGFSVTKGQKIQISFRVLDKDGNYDVNRKLTMMYGYWFMDE